MTPLLAWAKRTAEKWFGTWNEGPTAPERLREMVVYFANQHPRATRAEWAELASSLAAEAWEAGWRRGYEHVERSPDWRPDVPPEVLADWVTGDDSWRWQEGIRLEGPDRVPPEAAEPDTDLLRRQMNEILESAARGR